MILSFSVENFRSFDEEVTFSMVASKRLSDSHQNHLVNLSKVDINALRIGVIYGANGAGKSNFFKAIEHLRTIALKGRKKGTGTGRQNFRLRGKAKESSYDIQFFHAGNVYRYGLAYDNKSILEEWLIDVGDNEKLLYERTTKKNGDIQVKGDAVTENSKLKAFVEAGSGRREQTFLASINDFFNLEDLPKPIQQAISWFSNTLNLIYPAKDHGYLEEELDKNLSLRNFTNDFLRNSSTGINDVLVLRIPMEEDQIKRIVPLEFFDEGSVKGKITIRMGNPQGSATIFEKDEKGNYYQVTTQAAHKVSETESELFQINEESDGTRRLLQLLPALHKMQTGCKTYVIDEIERSIHPLLIYKFIEFFLNKCEGVHRQLIITTHESNLLDQELLRRDEIWFTEKNQAGATQMYSLSEYKVRKDFSIKKHYLEGRFGGVPFLGNIDKLIDEKEEFVDECS